MKAFGPRATFDDVNLILRLYDMRRDDRLREARRWFVANFKVRTFDEFTKLCAPGTEANASYRMVTSYWEMVASFINTGVLNADLFYQSGRELLFTYARARFMLPELRENKLGLGLPEIWLIYDFDPVHDTPGSAHSRKFLYADGHVD